MRLYYRFCRFLCQWLSTLYFKGRCHGLHHLPPEGGVLLVSNHQSYMDPVLAAMALPREGSYMARDSLFRNRFFGRLIGSLNAFPVRRGEADLSAIKEALRRLKQGHALLIFPEGTRTPDGTIRAMLPGVGAIAKKARVPIVPTLIDGVYQTWPRDRALPRPGNVIIEYGRPMMPAEYEHLSPEDLMAEIRRRLIAMQHRWHSRVPSRRLQWFEGGRGELRVEN
jgi:1-acyl-sn-glycerol-3-phosphate acyltransferase